MRIIVDPALPAFPASSHAPAPLGNRGAKVLIIRPGPDPTTSAGAKAPAPSVSYRTSDEAVDRDRQVRGHENAHLSALGPYAASGVLYATVKGAEGESIAVGGRIAVDLAEVPGDPAATLRKARVVFNAAGAPGDPSAADLRVAARAYRLMQKAQAELRVDQYA